MKEIGLKALDHKVCVVSCCFGRIAAVKPVDNTDTWNVCACVCVMLCYVCVNLRCAKYLNLLRQILAANLDSSCRSSYTSHLTVQYCFNAQNNRMLVLHFDY